MENNELKDAIYKFIRRSYPNMEVKIEAYSKDKNKLAIYFTEDKFIHLYPAQRHHYLTHLISHDFIDMYLKNTVWFELAPGEKAEDLVYPEPEFIRDISPNVMTCIAQSGFFEKLDDLMWPEDKNAPKTKCYGDFRTSKELLPTCGFKEDEFFDIFHVLMDKGGNCDCEILFNVAEQSRLKAQYWIARANNLKPYDPHSAQ